MKIIENKKEKIVASKNYNYFFNKTTGFFARWGKTEDEDPQMSNEGPEILDMEISDICTGINGKPCKFCYKSNTGSGKNMSFDTFKTIFHKMPKTLCQIAFGIGSVNTNPVLFKILQYTRDNGVIPNITINGEATDEELKILADVCGAISVSKYNPKDVCYNAVEKLTKNHNQINIHQLLSKNTLDDCYELIEDIKKDKRLKKLNAVVFLFLKPKGKRNNYKCVDRKEYKRLVDCLFENNIPFGFDSCTANLFLETIENKSNYDTLKDSCEACESGLFSSYINVEGKYFHCSFTEGEKGWKGIDIVACKDFLKDVWQAEETQKFRKMLLDNKRSCPIFKLY